MDKFGRKVRILKLFKQRRCLSSAWLEQEFECCEKTIYRDMKQLESDGYPIFKDSKRQAYCFNKAKFMEVEGLWFSPEELHALLLIQQLTEKLAGGALDMQPLSGKIEQLLGKMAPNTKEMSRFRVFHVGSRAKNMPNFGIMAKALLARKRLQIVYHGREKNTVSERTISPQRLVFYKGNWYVDAWCHHAKALRSFAVEQVIEANEKDLACRKVAEKTLDAYFTRSFGIFSGKPTHTAVLHFSEKAARWVKDEAWFPDTKGAYLKDGKYELQIPYNNPTELIMEICRYGAEVEVITPPELRHAVGQLLQKAAEQYC